MQDSSRLVLQRYDVTLFFKSDIYFSFSPCVVYSLRYGFVKEGEPSDSTQSRPNPPQFVQGIISMFTQHCLNISYLPVHNLFNIAFLILMLWSKNITISSDDAEKHQYEEWLLHTQQLLQMQLKFLEEQIGVHRKSRKALCAKQRTAKKAGREFAEADAEKLKLVTEEQSKIQKQLDQVCRLDL